jgi:hypothetical protein
VKKNPSGTGLVEVKLAKGTGFETSGMELELVE